MKLSLAHTSGLPYLSNRSAVIFVSSIFSLATALPADVANPQSLTLALPTNLTSLNLTHVNSPVPVKGWPPAPLAVLLAPQDPQYPKDVCILYFVQLGSEDGTPEATEALLEEILDQFNIYTLLPKHDPAKGFDVVRKGVRFVLEHVSKHLVPERPLNVYLTLEALDQLYGLVLSNLARELRALIECNGIALGRLRVWFD